MKVVTTVNLNEKVRVHLTPEGRKMLEERYGKGTQFRIQDGWYETQLWMLIQDFASAMGCGSAGTYVFENNELVFAVESHTYRRTRANCTARPFRDERFFLFSTKRDGRRVYASREHRAADSCAMSQYCSRCR